MRTRETAKTLGGSIVVYVIVAACGGAADNRIAGLDAGASDGTTGPDGTSLTDALMNPVPDAKADVDQSGSRLKATYYAGADGSKQALGMHDSQLNVDCYFQTASDGTLRCVPEVGQQADVAVYADSACKQGLAIQATGCATATYALLYGASSTCSNQSVWHVFPLAGAYAGPSYYSKSGATCAGPTPLANFVGYNLYTLGPELPPSTFVQATVQSE